MATFLNLDSVDIIEQQPIDFATVPGAIDSSCNKAYRFLWDAFDIYGRPGWASSEWGQNSLYPRLRSRDKMELCLL